MIAKAPQIGFDRFIHLDWVAAALRVRTEKGSLHELQSLLSAAGLGKEALAKTQTKLNAIVLEPTAALVDFLDRGVRLFASAKTPACIAPFAWGAALAAYPYFGRVSEFAGRLTAIQGDCAVSEVHRRMSEVYGDREIIKRATQAVLQTQVNWGALKRIEKGKRLARMKAIAVSNHDVAAWLIEAALHYYGRPMPLETLRSAPGLYPFRFEESLAYVLLNSDVLGLRSDGTVREVVGLNSMYVDR